MTRARAVKYLWEWLVGQLGNSRLIVRCAWNNYHLRHCAIGSEKNEA